jgi:DNA mismatch endonuclease (patch repair protein)
MADVFSRAKRSEVMSLIRSSGNGATELRMIALLRAHKLTGWRRGVPLLGRPDFVWRGERVALFVDGCFWHNCPRHGRVPHSRQEYWIGKLAGNARRDRLVSRALRAGGWTVIRVWECALHKSTARRAATRIASALGRPKAARRS